MPKISQYDAVSSPADDDIYVVVQGGVTKKITYSTLKSGVIGDVDAFIYKGVIDCAASPNYPAADAGHIYVVSGAGKIGGGSGTVVAVGDMLICNTDGTAAGTQAAVGSKWNIVEKNIDLSNVAITGGSISGADITVGSAKTLDVSAGTTKMANIADATLSGTPKVFVIYDGTTPYYIKGYPTKS